MCNLHLKFEIQKSKNRARRIINTFSYKIIIIIIKEVYIHKATSIGMNHLISGGGIFFLMTSYFFSLFAQEVICFQK